jgi:glycine/D-amino acid oxidase-like deaminating enzyme
MAKAGWSRVVRVCVLGAGIQGVLCALELAERGHDIVICDALEDAIMAASLHNEGKIHLGYVYAKDTSDRTSRLMARGASQFSRLLDRWWPEPEIEATASEPFDYLVLPESLETADWLSARYRQMDTGISACLASSGASYLSRRSIRPVERLNQRELETRYNTDTVAAAFRTGERAIDLTRMAAALRSALAVHPRIERRWNTRIEAVSESDNGSFSVRTEGEAPEGSFDAVVNALWSDRLRIDHGMGIHVRRPFLFRQKVAVRMALPEASGFDLSATMVIGPFGDFVSLPSGETYLSWYPSACLRHTQDVAPPPDWANTGDGMQDDVVEACVAELGRRINGIGGIRKRARSTRAVPGVIFSWGDSDIDDTESELHQRHDVGINAYRPGYYSIDTGKLTLAPIFAAELAERIGSK